MSSPAALYFLHSVTLSSSKCSWQREYFELTAEGRESSVVEREDKTSYISSYPKLWLPAGVVMATRADYRAAKLRHVLGLREAFRKERAEREARKLLRGSKVSAEPAPSEATAPVPVLLALPTNPLDDYTVFDCETTGFSHDKDHLLELAATRYTNGKPVESMQSFVRYTGYIPPRITELTTISTKHVFRAPDVKEVLQEFRRIAGDSLLVGHNVAFDLRFVNAARARLGAPAALTNPFLCTQVVASSRYPAPHKLGELCKRFGINTTGAHRAGNDVLMTAKLLQHMHQVQPITQELVNLTSAPKAKAAAQPTLDFAA
jgi:DNA polymerase-3 subunit epsilon